jgi:hypothetical protein
VPRRSQAAVEFQVEPQALGERRRVLGQPAAVGFKLGDVGPQVVDTTTSTPPSP